MKRALITGASGQDGHYLSEHLLGLGYDVFGLVRRTSTPPMVPRGVTPIEGDLTDLPSIQRAIDTVMPNEVYNLAAQSHVGTSFITPITTAQINALGAHHVFEAAFAAKAGIRVYQAGTSEQFGHSGRGPYPALSESTPFDPRSPYAASKVYAHHIARNYRERGLFISNGILFNHESPRRGPNFVTRKITLGLAKVVRGEADCVVLGNMTACRDWGFAGDYVKAMHGMLQLDEPNDFVLGTGLAHSVSDFARLACLRAGLDFNTAIRSTPTEFRPTDVQYLRADPTKARRLLGWNPAVGFEALVNMMVDHDLA